MTFLTTIIERNPASAATSFAIIGPLYILFLVVVRLILPTILIILLIKAVLKYLHTGEIRREKSVVRKSLGEALKDHRVRCQMTQEFVAEHLGVSRQAVSKWENGSSDPSTSNLLALARLYGVDAAELLRDVAPTE